MKMTRREFLVICAAVASADELRLLEPRDELVEFHNAYELPGYGEQAAREALFA